MVSESTAKHTLGIQALYDALVFTQPKEVQLIQRCLHLLQQTVLIIMVAMAILVNRRSPIAQAIRLREANRETGIASVRNLAAIRYFLSQFAEATVRGIRSCRALH